VTRVAVLYDIHANVTALDAVLAEVDGLGVERYVLGGDYIARAPFAQQALARLRGLDALVWLRGNGERWLAEPPLDRPEIGPSVLLMAEDLGAEEVARLCALPERWEHGRVLFVHGSPLSDVESFHAEPQTDDEALLMGVRDRIVVFGHSHLQFRRPGPDGTDLINPGSVGMPLDHDLRAAWALWDGAEGFELRRTEYDVERGAADYRASGLDFFADRLLRGSD
jgi:diadenosine tetraphosphatase ApaH/serine/threonine PP2A family protein phosphatase